jgi:hypothetical protein
MIATGKGDIVRRFLSLSRTAAPSAAIRRVRTHVRVE